MHQSTEVCVFNRINDTFLMVLQQKFNICLLNISRLLMWDIAYMQTHAFRHTLTKTPLFVCPYIHYCQNMQKQNSHNCPLLSDEFTDTVRKPPLVGEWSFGHDNVEGIRSSAVPREHSDS